MGFKPAEDVARLTMERDRYKVAWLNARGRAWLAQHPDATVPSPEALSEGTVTARTAGWEGSSVPEEERKRLVTDSGFVLNEPVSVTPSAPEMADMLRTMGYGVTEPPDPREPNKCFRCGISETETDILVDIRVLVHEGEEGHSDVTRFVCDEHLIELSRALIKLGFGVHAHGGICFLEVTECLGHRHMDDCPTPENQYPDTLWC